MLAPVSWIREYVDLPEDLTTEELAARLTALGLKLEALHRPGHDIEGPLVVGRVLTNSWETGRGSMRSGFKRLAAVVRVSVSLGVRTHRAEARPVATHEVCSSGCAYTTINAAVTSASTVNGDTLAVRAGTFTESVNATKTGSQIFP